MRTNFLVSGILAACVSVTAAPTLTSPSSAALSPRQNDNSSPPSPFQNWHATDFTWGSSPGGTAGTLHLAAEEGYFEGAPGFNVVCHPIMVQRGWTPCRAPDNSELPRGNRVDIIWTSGPVQGRFYLGAAHIFEIAKCGSWVNATARTDIEVPRPPQAGASFEFPVTHLAVSGTEPPLSE